MIKIEHLVNSTHNFIIIPSSFSSSSFAFEAEIMICRAGGLMNPSYRTWSINESSEL